MLSVNNSIGNSMSVEIKISVNKGLYLKEPQDTELGRKIIKNSIILFNKFGFESFNFKKLAQEINSTEASIYRYFENKHLLLLYLVNWYWEWVSYLITFNTMNILNPRIKLQIIIHSFVSAATDGNGLEYISESKLHYIVISEGIKAYHTKGVDKDNSKGFFLSYKNMVNKVSQVILEVDPNFRYPNALATNLYETANNHIYFAKHLPRLTDISKEANNAGEVEKMLNFFTDKLLA